MFIAHADLAQKYSVGLQEIFVSSLCSQKENSFFPALLLPSFRTNILAKFVVNFVPNEGGRTKTGYSFISCCFVKVWARIRRSVFINSDTWEDTLSNHH
jgi:hypothetical protein